MNDKLVLPSGTVITLSPLPDGDLSFLRRAVAKQKQVDEGVVGWGTDNIRRLDDVTIAILASGEYNGMTPSEVVRYAASVVREIARVRQVIRL